MVEGIGSVSHIRSVDVLCSSTGRMLHREGVEGREVGEGREGRDVCTPGSSGIAWMVDHFHRT